MVAVIGVGEGATSWTRTVEVAARPSRSVTVTVTSWYSTVPGAGVSNLTATLWIGWKVIDVLPPIAASGVRATRPVITPPTWMASDCTKARS